MTKKHYIYNIAKEYDREVFTKTVAQLEKNTINIESSEYIEELLDGDQIQIIKAPEGQVKVINDFMVGAVWVESEINLDDIL